MAETSDGIRIVCIIGTTRPDNYTSKAMALVVDELGKNDEIITDVVDPADWSLSFPGQGDGSGDGDKLRDLVSSATGIILSTPEYHGGYSSMVKLIIENLGFPSVLAGKPVALLGVAAGQIGAIKALEQLRSVCSHIGAIVLPGPVSVAGVQSMFDEAGRCTDASTEKRIRGVSTALVDYIRGNICPRIALEEMVRSGGS